MKHGSLFSGIGGFDLAAEWMGWENVFHCENNKFCNKILKQHFPNSIEYDNIKETDFTKHKGSLDIISGGFPCQPYSCAGKRKGKEDERHLFPEMLRAVREIQPTWIVGENVLGLVNWNGGLVFNEVQTDLENEGYEVQPVILPACGVNAPHKRERVWFIAYSNSNGYKLRGLGENRSAESESIKQQEQWQWIWSNIRRIGKSGAFTHSNEYGLQGNKSESQTSRNINGFNEISRWENYPSKPGICRGNDGIPNRMDRIKGLGNAIVPQVALQIFRVIDQIAVRQKDFKNF